jgi:hypothetical protein
MESTALRETVVRNDSRSSAVSWGAVIAGSFHLGWSVQSLLNYTADSMRALGFEETPLT